MLEILSDKETNFKVFANGNIDLSLMNDTELFLFAEQIENLIFVQKHNGELVNENERTNTK